MSYGLVRAVFSRVLRPRDAGVPLPARQEGQDMASDDAATLGALKELLDAFNRHDLDAIMKLFAEDAILEMPRGPHPWGQRYAGKAQVREGLASRFAGLPDVHYEEHRSWACGDMGVSEWTLTGTTPSGTRLEVRGTDHYEFRAGQVVRKDAYWKIVEK